MLYMSYYYMDIYTYIGEGEEKKIIQKKMIIEPSIVELMNLDSTVHRAEFQLGVLAVKALDEVMIMKEENER